MDSCARFYIALSLELRQAQLANESAIKHKERKMFFRLGDETQNELRQQKAQAVHEQHQLAEEGEARIHFDRHLVESEQRAALRILESVSQDGDLVRQEAQRLRGNSHRSKQAAQLQGTKLKIQFFS